MKLYRLIRTQTLPASQEEAWKFFSSPHNLPAITPHWLNLAAREEGLDIRRIHDLIRQPKNPGH